jgi:hypothetical protein
MKEQNDLITFPGLAAPNILIPRKQYNLKKWAVVACDQYTSEPGYWEKTAAYVGEAPSTLNLVFPEVYLGKDTNARINSINKKMAEYLDSGIFDTFEESFFLVHRKTPVNPEGRWGLIAALDLEQYDYAKGSKSLIRATEGTILDRIPPRKQIRRDAPLELPHILVLIDDKDLRVIEPLSARRNELEIVYTTELMNNGGSITAYRIHSDEDFKQITDALHRLADPQAFFEKYGSNDVLLYAMGDGNHSLATAKSCWEDIKKQAQFQESALEKHPARYALVEIENIFDPGIVFEPIHRVLFNCKKNKLFDILSRHCSGYHVKEAVSIEEMMNLVESSTEQAFGYADSKGTEVVFIKNPESEITAGTLQAAIDEYLLLNPITTIDYTHGTEATYELVKKSGNSALFLPAISKSDFFPAIINDGALPRKTFSMGEADEKRYYIEARRIIP